MGKYRVKRELGPIYLTSSLCVSVCKLVEDWCSADTEPISDLSISVSGVDEHGVSRDAEFADGELAAEFVARLSSVTKLTLLHYGSRMVDVLLRGAGENVYSEISATCEDEPVAESFVNSVFEVANLAAVNSLGKLINETKPKISRKIQILHIDLGPQSIRRLLGEVYARVTQDASFQGTIAIVGTDNTKRVLSVSAKSIAQALLSVGQLDCISSFSVTMYGENCLDAYLDNRFPPFTLTVETCEAAWAETMTSAVRDWERACRLKGFRLISSRLARASVSYGPYCLCVVLLVLMGLGVVRRLDRLVKVQTSSQQLRNLEEARGNLRAATAYMDKLTSALRSREIALEAVKRQHKEWEPLVKADKQVIEGIGELVAQQSRRDRWVDMLISFAIGFLSSCAATWLYLLKRRSPSPVGAATEALRHGTTGTDGR